MAKSDAPALRMKVEGGRLVPLTPFDAERLNSYRNNTTVMVKLSPPKDRVQIRRWFAILNIVVKQCSTPWKNTDEAHEAIKLALGIVNLSKTVSGQYMQYPKSLMDLDDPELDDAVAQMIELLSRITGVDVSTLRKEAANVGNEIEETNSNSDGEPISEPSQSDAGVIPLSPALVGEVVDSSSPSPTYKLRNHLKDFARKGFKTLSDPISDDAKSSALDLMCGQYQTLIDTGEITQDDWEHFKKIIKAFKAVFSGQRTIDQGREFAAKEIGCRVTEIGG